MQHQAQSIERKKADIDTKEKDQSNARRRARYQEVKDDTNAKQRARRQKKSQEKRKAVEQQRGEALQARIREQEFVYTVTDPGYCEYWGTQEHGKDVFYHNVPATVPTQDEAIDRSFRKMSMGAESINRCADVLSTYNNRELFYKIQQWGLVHGYQNCNGDFLTDLESYFVPFSGSEHMHHPYHQHSDTMRDLSMQLSAILTSIRSISLHPEHTQVEAVEYIKRGVLPSLHHIAKKVRALIIPMQGCYYGKLHALNIVLRYDPNTKMRAKAIKDLVENGHVPSGKALCNLIRDHKNGIFVVDEEWNTVGCKKPISTNINKYGDGIGILILALQTTIFEPPRPIFLRDYIGVDGLRGPHERLYFSPYQFPTPDNLDDAVYCNVFRVLVYYIEQSSKLGDSPVVHNGGSRLDSRRFVCSYSNRKSRDKKNSGLDQCQFSFLVEWDKYGYFIPTTAGCMYHNHYALHL